jgi:hypothetical protein
MGRLSVLVRKAVLPVLMTGSILVFLSFAGYATAEARVSVGVGIGYNSDDFGFLARYGQWENYGSYGQVWRPWVGSDWRPFMYGDWEWDGSDWYWVSYEPFGDIVFHYGSWEYDPVYGWFWIPGDVWSPAPVEWFWYGDFACWAPLRFDHGHWGDPWGEHGRHIWNVVRDRDFTRENVGKYRVQPGEMPHGGREISFHHQPSVNFVGRVTHQRVATVNITVERPNGAAPGQFRRTMLPPATAERVQRYRSQGEWSGMYRGYLRPMPSRGTQQRGGNGWNGIQPAPQENRGNEGIWPSGGYHGDNRGRQQRSMNGWNNSPRQHPTSNWNSRPQQRPTSSWNNHPQQRPTSGWNGGGRPQPYGGHGNMGGDRRSFGGGAHWGGGYRNPRR